MIQDWSLVLTLGFADLWPYASAIGIFLIDLLSSIHVILNKRDTRAAIAWAGFIWFVPLGGSLLYFLLGVNRVERRARRLLRSDVRIQSPAVVNPDCLITEDSLAQLGEFLPPLARVVTQVSDYPLVTGNRVVQLDRLTAFPAMLSAINGAKDSISLASYIFDNDSTGKQFVDALASASQRGVEIRVLVDDVGSRYSWPSIFGPLRRAGIPCASFYPRRVPLAFLHANLRNHRKLLVVDGTIGFTGGMNIRDRQSPSPRNAGIIHDLHFQLTGPIVFQLQHAFAQDWNSAGNEVLTGEKWFPAISSAGHAICRAIVDGPDTHLDNMRTTFSAGLACAQRRVQIMTPYFLPDRDLISALNLTAMRGVTVDIVLPQENNLVFVEWASMAIRWQMLERGCRFWMSPPPFDHSKLFVVDGLWSLFGSTNWDPRSLRLNFEFNVECYDAALSAHLEQLVDSRIREARSLTLHDVDSRSLPIQLRDGVAKLFSLYL